MAGFVDTPLLLVSLFFFFNDTATTEIYTLSLHDALPISTPRRSAACGFGAGRSAAGSAGWRGCDCTATTPRRGCLPPPPLSRLSQRGRPRWRQPSRRRTAPHGPQSLPRLPELLLRLAEREPHELASELRPADEARAGDGCDARFAGEAARERVVR